MFWNRNKPKVTTLIHVDMIDAESGQPFAQTDLPPDQLPESFEASTTLHVGNDDYSVEQADPMTAAEFRKTGRLRLVLRRVKIESIDPRKVLFSLPTISDELPPIEPDSTKLKKNVLEIHEDDWRQNEFVHLSCDLQVEQELTDVARVHREQRVGIGFKHIHVRRRVPTPLAAARIESLSLFVPGASPYDGLAFHGVAGVVAGGFATRLPSSLDLYGVHRDGLLAFLCVRQNGPIDPDAPDLPLLAGLAHAHQLCLVDWCRCERVMPSPSEFSWYFSERDGRA